MKNFYKYMDFDDYNKTIILTDNENIVNNYRIDNAFNFIYQNIFIKNIEEIEKGLSNNLYFLVIKI